MERITYRKTLDVHKNGTQFLLQGFETADKLSRVIEISLMASGDAIDFPLERIVAMMYVNTPKATEPSINQCTIKDNKVVYDVLPIVEEGITTMQLKLIETSPEGATSVLASPKFAVEVSKSDATDGGEELNQKFSSTAIEEFIAKADAAYGSRLERIELSSDCIFRAYYADKTKYETDILKNLFYNGNVALSESYAHGGTGARAGEETDNSMYYCNVARSESLNAKAIMKNSEEVLEEVKRHGMYTAFSVDFTTGKVEYVSPSFEFKVNNETGDLDAVGQSYTFIDEIGRVTTEWLDEMGVVFSTLKDVSETYPETVKTMNMLKDRVIPIELGGTGATNAEDAFVNLGLGGVKMATGTYEGNSESSGSADTPNTVTLDFVPYVFIVAPMGSDTNTRDYSFYGTLVWSYGRNDLGMFKTGENSGALIRFDLKETTLSWYSLVVPSGLGAENRDYQFNHTGTTYTWVAFGRGA